MFRACRVLSHLPRVLVPSSLFLSPSHVLWFFCEFSDLKIAPHLLHAKVTLASLCILLIWILRPPWFLKSLSHISHVFDVAWGYRSSFLSFHRFTISHLTFPIYAGAPFVLSSLASILFCPESVCGNECERDRQCYVFFPRTFR